MFKNFSLRRMLRMTRKEFNHIVRDPGFLFLAVISPAFLLVLLGYVFSFDVEYSRLALYDRDQSQLSQQYVSFLGADGELDFVRQVGSYDEAYSLMERGAVAGLLVVPPGFGTDLSAGRVANVQLLTDGSDTSLASAVGNSISARTAAFALQQTGGFPQVFEVEPRVWFNPTLRTQYSMVPGLVPIVLVLPSMAAALGATRERQTGTFETIVTTPVSGMEFLTGKLLAYVLTGLVGTLLALVVAVGLFDVPFRGSVFLYLLLTADYFLALMGMCLLISNFTSSQQTATVVILLMFFMPSFFQSGLFLPVDQSSFISVLSSGFQPATYFVTISRWIALRSAGPGLLWREALTLVGMGLVAISASIFLFKKKVG